MYNYRASGANFFMSQNAEPGYYYAYEKAVDMTILYYFDGRQVSALQTWEGEPDEDLICQKIEQFSNRRDDD